MKSYSQQVYRATYTEMRLAMIGRFVLGGCAMVLGVLGANVASAQDVPGIEICTVEKTMERRTSCLQSNVEFLQKTIVKLDAQHQQRLDAANRQIESLKASLAVLQKAVEELQAAQKKAADDLKKTGVPKDSPVKDAPAKDGVPKEGGK